MNIVPLFLSIVRCLSLGVVFLANPLWAIPQEGLTAYWSFDGTFANSPFASGNQDPANATHLDLAAFGDARIDPNGFIGQAARFDGSGDYLSLFKDGSEDKEVVEDAPFSAATISVLFKVNRAPTGSERFFIYETTPNFTISLGLRQDTTLDGNTLIQAFTDPDASAKPRVSISLSNSNLAGRWVHALVSLNTNQLSLRVNGGAPATTSFTAPLQSFDDFRIGTFRSASGRFFPGLIDELAIWNRELTEEERQGLAYLGLTVTSLEDNDDGTDNNENLTLRKAIRRVPNQGIVRFAPSLSGGTITLNGTQLLIQKSLTIDASMLASGLTIDANDESRVMEIHPNISVALHGLTLTGGRALGSFGAGGAIYANGSGTGNCLQLYINACSIIDNQAFEDGGSGIFSDGSKGGHARVSLQRCTVSGNSTRSNGGGLTNNGFEGRAEMYLRLCTITNNSTSFNRGGGIFNFGSEGVASLSLKSCTISGNSGTISGVGVASVSSIQGVAILSLENTILAGNISPSRSDNPDLLLNGNATLDASGINLLSSRTRLSSLGESESIELVETPLLSPLGHYGGPTQTMIPLPASPAINRASGSTADTDQRGTPITDGMPDIGAVEAPDWSSPTQEELTLAFSSDGDRDGNVYGMEILLGTDPFTSDPGHPNNPKALAGGRAFSFGRDRAVQFSYRIDVDRSFDLSLDSFERVYSYNSFTHEELSAFQSPEITSNIQSDEEILQLIDSNTTERAFYRLRFVLDP